MSKKRKSIAVDEDVRIQALFAFSSNGKELIGLYSSQSLAYSASIKIKGFEEFIIEEIIVDKNRF